MVTFIYRKIFCIKYANVKLRPFVKIKLIPSINSLLLPLIFVQVSVSERFEMIGLVVATIYLFCIMYIHMLKCMYGAYIDACVAHYASSLNVDHFYDNVDPNHSTHMYFICFSSHIHSNYNTTENVCVSRKL